jgi:hypothetical protein
VEEWVKVAAAPNETLALVMKGLLDEAGIPALVADALNVTRVGRPHQVADRRGVTQFGRSYAPIRHNLPFQRAMCEAGRMNDC